MNDPVQVPLFWMMQICESTINKCANKIERERRSFISTQQQLRIWRACSKSEFWTIDIISTKRRQRNTATYFLIRLSRLCVLTCEATNSNNSLSRSVREHQTHLQQNLQLIRDRRRSAIRKALCTIATMQNESFASSSFSQLRLQRSDFATRDKRRQFFNLRNHAPSLERIWPYSLLTCTSRTPRIGRPFTHMVKSIGEQYGRQESNLHGFPHWNLNPARLPIPPRPHLHDFVR